MNKQVFNHKKRPRLYCFEKQYFSCINCGKCCRHWDVPISAREKEFLEKSGICSTKRESVKRCLIRDKSRSNVWFIKKYGNDCVFLDTSNFCRIHSEIGEYAKPLACRLYPFDLMNWSDNSISASARYDCPSVVSEKGKDIGNYKNMLVSVSAEIAKSGKISHAKYSLKLDPGVDKLRIIARAYKEIILNKDFPPAIRLSGASELLNFHSQPQNSPDIMTADEPFFMNDAVALFKRSNDYLKNELANTIMLDIRKRILFRYLICGFLRSDSETGGLKTNLFSRISRTWRILRFSLGKCSVGNFMKEFREPNIEADPFFPSKGFAIEKDALETLWNYASSKFDSLHFCGMPGRGMTFEEGMKTLLISFPVISGLAYLIGVQRKADSLSKKDFSNAIMIADHTFSRSPFFSSGHVKRIMKELCEPANYRQLLKSTFSF